MTRLLAKPQRRNRKVAAINRGDSSKGCAGLFPDCPTVLFAARAAWRAAFPDSSAGRPPTSPRHFVFDFEKSRLPGSESPLSAADLRSIAESDSDVSLPVFQNQGTSGPFEWTPLRSWFGATAGNSGSRPRLLENNALGNSMTIHCVRSHDAGASVRSMASTSANVPTRTSMRNE